MSTTRPPRNPSPARKARSVRLPSAPPRMMPSPSAHAALLGPHAHHHQDATTSTQPTSAIAVVLPEPEREGGPVVEHEVEPQRADQVDGAVGQRRQRPLLGQLVEDDDDRRRAEEGAQVAAPARPCGPQRRVKPALLHCTQSAAYGRARRRSFGMVLWHCSHTP